MLDLIKEALGQLVTLVVGIVLLVWWIGGPAVRP